MKHRAAPFPAARTVALLAAPLMLLAACGRDAGPSNAVASAPVGATAPASVAGSAAQAPAPAASAPPVSVTTVIARQRDVPVQLPATGTVVPVSSVEVRPQVTSVVTKVHAREGQFVKAGELLFTLDARSDEANVAKLRAQMAKDQAALADAQRQLARSRELLAQNFVSQGVVDSNQTLVESATAVLAADRASLDAAQLTLGYSRVVAPGPGRVGAIGVFAGSSVIANQTTLVTVTQLDPIDVAFSVPQRHLPDLLAALQVGAAVTATLPDNGGTLNGRLQFVDNAIDGASGTVKVKARFANPQHRLWPGAFVAAALTLKTLPDAVVIPQAAIAQTPRGAVAFAVVGGKAVPRPVQVAVALGEEAVVTGLKPGERIVLDGRQNLRPGATVVERPREGAGPGGAGGGGGRAGAGGGGVRPASAPGAASGANPGPTPDTAASAAPGTAATGATR
jgi:RND family efflux transporter MFP subunit